MIHVMELLPPPFQIETFKIKTWIKFFCKTRVYYTNKCEKGRKSGKYVLNEEGCQKGSEK